MFAEGNQRTGLEGLLLNCQHHHFHHILHSSKLPYQQHDLKADQGTTISAFSDAQLKDVKLGFFYTVLVQAVSASNIILKRTHLAEKRNRARFTNAEEGAQ